MIKGRDQEHTQFLSWKRARFFYWLDKMTDGIRRKGSVQYIRYCTEMARANKESAK